MAININEIKNESLTKNEKEMMANIVNKQNHNIEMVCPNYKYYQYTTGKKYGTCIERDIINSINDISKSIRDNSFDAKSSIDERIEIKSIRIGSRGYNLIFRKEDDITHEKLANNNFQQVKPNCTDWFILHLLFANGSRLFVVPSNMISNKVGIDGKEPGKFLLHPQHRGHQYEGEINVKTILNNANLFEISDYDLKKSYNFEDMKNKVKENLANGFNLVY